MTRKTHRTTAVLSGAVLALAGLAAPAATAQASADVIPSSSAAIGSQDDPIPTYAVAYADDFVRAWGRGDRDRMDLLATSPVLAALPDSGGSAWYRTGADAGWGKVFVSYRNSATGDEMTLMVINELAGQGRPDAIQDVIYTDAALPRTPVAYADGLVRAWGAGAVRAEKRFATEEVVDALGAAGGPDWVRVASEGAAGSVYVTYRNGVTGQRLVLRVISEAASQGRPQAVVEARFSG